MRSPKVTPSSVIHHPSSIVSALVLAVVCCLLSSCSEWNTDALGHSFYPANSQVRQFTHPLYVEYTQSGARVWGPAAAEVDYDVERHHVTIRSSIDSLALFAYGYPASQDTMARTDASLTIASASPYALYFDGLCLRSQDGPVIRSQGDAPCYFVLSRGTKSHLYGQIAIDGPLHLTGQGSLEVDHDGSCITAAALYCQYAVTVSLRSQSGSGVELRGPMRSILGTWYIHAADCGITSPDSIVLLDGTYQGTARRGAFLSAPQGVILRHPRLIAAAAVHSPVLDSVSLAMRHDSITPVWAQRLDTLQLMADSTYQIFRHRSKSALSSFLPRHDVARPCILFANGTILPTDTLDFILKPTVKKK